MVFAVFGLACHRLVPPTIETVRMLSFEQNDQRIPLRRLAGSPALFFQSKLSCDVDGAPNAYHPLDDGLSLDLIGSAGGVRVGNGPAGPLEVLPSPEVVVYLHGAPFVQTNGEYKGFYVSETSFSNPSLPVTSASRYLDARHVPYIVLPGGLVPEAELGDLAIVYDPASGRRTGAIYGDIGPSNESGEASLATIRGLGLPVVDGKSSPGQARDDLFYLVFPNTAHVTAGVKEWPLKATEINRLAESEFQTWGGSERIATLLAADRRGGSVADTPETRDVYDELAAIRRDNLAPAFPFGLPPRYGVGGTTRLPCAPEIVAECNSALLNAQRMIGDVEASKAPLATLDPIPGHLERLAAIFARFRMETIDETDGPVKVQTRLDDLRQRIRDLQNADAG